MTEHSDDQVPEVDAGKFNHTYNAYRCIHCSLPIIIDIIHYNMRDSLNCVFPAVGVNSETAVATAAASMTAYSPLCFSKI